MENRKAATIGGGIGILIACPLWLLFGIGGWFFFPSILLLIGVLFGGIYGAIFGSAISLWQRYRFLESTRSEADLFLHANEGMGWVSIGAAAILIAFQFIYEPAPDGFRKVIGCWGTFLCLPANFLLTLFAGTFLSLGLALRPLSSSKSLIILFIGLISNITALAYIWQH